MITQQGGEENVANFQCSMVPMQNEMNIAHLEEYHWQFITKQAQGAEVLNISNNVYILFLYFLFKNLTDNENDV